MKYKSLIRKKRIEILALAAALAFTFAADSLFRPFDFYASAAAESDDDESSSAEDTKAEIKSDILDVTHGSVEFWRWERVGKNNYPQDNEWTMSLFFFGDYSMPFRDDKLFSALAPNAITIGPEADPIPGGSNVITKTHGSEYYSRFVSDSSGAWGDTIREQYAHYIALDTTYTQPASQRLFGADTSKDVFFTTADMNPVYVKYTGTNSDEGSGVIGSKWPMYKIRLKSSNDREYYLAPTDKNSESLPKIVTSESSAKSFTFRPFDMNSGNALDNNMMMLAFNSMLSNPSQENVLKAFYGVSTIEELKEVSIRNGIVWVPYIYDKGNDDEVLVTRNTSFVFTADDGDYGRMSDRCKWYIGKKYLFSALEGNTTIKEGQILSISEKDYIRADGALYFTLYNFDANFNDLLSKNNTAFLNGTLTKLEFIQECKGLQGMYYQGVPTRMPTISKASSAKFTDISKTSSLTPTDLTL